MFEFFIALFGGAYFITKFAAHRAQKRADEINERERSVHIKALERQYRADPELVDRVKKQVERDFEDLKREFRDDLVYIYGKDLSKNRYDPETKTLRWHYDMKECLKHLILARDYKKLAEFYFGYTAGYRREHVPYSLRMFKRMNEYMGVAECQLTMKPHGAPPNYSWSPCRAYFRPAATNICSSYPESRMESWSKYC